MTNYYNYNGQKDLPPVPPKVLGGDTGHPGAYKQHTNSFSRAEDDFNFVDPNSHIDNSIRDNVFRPANPNLSLNNRIIYDYDTDNESEGGALGYHGKTANQRELARTNHENEFYMQSNKSDLSRQSSTKSNPFKEDPFSEASKRHSRSRPLNDVEEPNDSFDNVPIKSDPAATSLLNPYRNNRFYNNESRTINGGFRVNDEFGPNELRPRFVADPASDKKPSGLLVWRGKKLPIVNYVLTVIQVIVFIVELGKMGLYTGSPVQTKPYFNPMIGPSSYVQINMGSRFAPCMIDIPGITNYTSNVFPCPNSTDVSSGCPLNVLCGLGGVEQKPDGFRPRQWYRIVTPIFLHAGFIHIICNMLLQVMLGVDMERQIGLVTYLVIYMTAGISGNIFGANFAQNGLSSTGASGALFGIIGVNLIHFLFFTNRLQMHPKTYRKNLSYLIFEIIFTLVLGLLPGLDNFSHIGGFVAGCLLSVVLLKDPNFIFQERYRYQRDPSDINKSAIPARNSLNSFTPFEYDGAAERANAANTNTDHIRTINSKVEEFLPNIHIRKTPVFFGWVGARIVCGLLIFLWFYFLSINFFRNGGGHCSWCQYLSCIPVRDWCTMGKIELDNLSGGTSTASLLIINFFIFFVASHFKIISTRLSTKVKQQ